MTGRQPTPAASDAGRVVVDRKGPVAWITLDRPQKRNALSNEILLGLLAALRSIAGDPAAKVIVLTGRGTAFSAGGDVAGMERMDEAEFVETIHLYMRLSQAFRSHDLLTIAAVNGPAMAGGFELALMCDLRVAAASARFGLPDMALGLSPTSGMTWLLPRIVGLGRAFHLTVLGEPIDAVEAERIGLVTRVVPEASLGAEVQVMAERIAAYPREAVVGTKQGFYRAADGDFASTLAAEESYELACFRSPETKRLFAEFVARRRKS